MLFPNKWHEGFTNFCYFFYGLPVADLPQSMGCWCCKIPPLNLGSFGKVSLPAEGCQPSKLGLVSQKELGMFSLKNWGEGDLIFDLMFFFLDWNYQAEIVISSFLGGWGGQNEFTFQSWTGDTPKLWFKLLIFFIFWRGSTDSSKIVLPHNHRSKRIMWVNPPTFLNKISPK